MRRLINYFLFLVLFSVPFLSVQASATPISKFALSSLYQDDDEDDEEEDWYMDWIENNEMAWEFCNQLNANRSLYPGEVPDEEGYIDEEQLKEARDIGQYADYKCVMKWVAKRDTLREQYQKLRAEVEAAYKEGQLGPDGTKRGLVVTYMNFIVRDVDEVHYAFLEELNEEYDSHHYVYGGSSAWNLRDGDPMSVEYTWISRTDGYVDYYFYSYKDLDLTGYAISTTNQVENPYHVKLPDKWALYGYYSDDKDTREYYEIPISEYTLLDSKDNYNFPWLESARKVFKLNHSGHYNRYVLRFYFTGKEDETVQRLAFTQFELLEGNVVASDDVTTPDPEMPELTIVQNESPTSLFPWLRVRSDVGQPGSPFEFLDRNVEPKIIFRHVDPQYGTFEYSRPTRPLIYAFFDEQGYLDVPLSTSWNVDIFHLTYFPQVPNHACDVIMTYKVVEKATGRIYEVTETIPYYIRYPGADIDIADSHVLGTQPRQETEFKTVISDLSYDEGYSLDVEISDYSSGSYATRHLSMDCDAIPDLPDRYDYERSSEYNAKIGVNSSEWVTYTNEYGDYYGRPVAVVRFPIVCGDKNVAVKVTAYNKKGESTITKTGHVSYETFVVDDHFKGTYTYGENGEGPTFDINDWVEDNQKERDAFVDALNSQKYNDILDAYQAYRQSCFRTISYSVPSEWGDAHDDRSFWYPEGEGKIYVKFPATKEETYSITLYWDKVHAQKTFTFKSAPIPEDMYIFRPIVEGASGDRSLTMYYKTKGTSDISYKSFVGKFGSEEENPSCVVLNEPISEYGYLSFRDNATKATSYHNKAKSADYLKIYNPNAIVIDASNTQQILPIGLTSYFARYYDRFEYSDYPIKDTDGNLLNVLESTLTETPVVRLQLIDEAGNPIDDDNVYVRSAYISQPIGEPIPMGTSPSFNPFIQGETVTASKGIDGIVDIKIPAPEEGYINHAFVEVCDQYYTKKYNARLISELTTPEAFSEYINKGLPYPCVLTESTSSSDLKPVNIWVRPTDSELFSADCVSYAVASGTEMGYEGGEKNTIDVLATFRTSLSLEEGEPVSLANGTVEVPWTATHYFKLLAPKRSYSEKKNGTYTWRGTFDNEKLDDAVIARDKSGRNVIWSRTQTGFYNNYMYLTCEPYHILPNMRKGDTQPSSDDIVLAKFNKAQIDANGKVDNKTNFEDYFGSAKWVYNPLVSSPLAKAYNTAVEEVDPESYLEDMAKTATPGYDGSMVKNDKSISKISGGLAGFNMATPGCLPFLNVLVTSEKGEYRVRSSFELNAMDFGKPAFGAWEKIKDQQQRVNDVSNYLQQFLLIKNSCIGDYTTDIFNTDDGVFVGFKGFTEMAIIKDYKENTWKPYFTGFGAKLEASAQYSWKMHSPPFIAKMITRGEVSSSFMLLNPHPEDFIYKQAVLDPKQGIDAETFNPYSHFNMYVNSTFDLSLCLQGGIGFDAGFIAAHGGLMGKARAAARFAYVNRPYLSGSLRESAGSRFDLEASLSAYAYFKFLFIKYTKEWKICGVEKTFWKPDNDWNPLKSDPNLRPELLTAKSRVHARSLAASYLPPRRRVSVIGSKPITDNVDIFANPIYLNGGSRLAYFNINNPNDQNDDRVLVSGEGCDINNSSQLYGDDVPAFTYHAASAGNHQIVAVQRLSQQLSDSDNTIEKASGLSKELQIVASVGDNSGTFVPTVVSTHGSANTDPKAAISQNGNAAIVWASGEISLKETADDEGDTYTEPVMKGDIVVSKYDKNLLGGTWLAPVSLVPTNEDSQVKDYAIAMGGNTPLVIASIPGTNSEGEHTAPTYLMTVTPSATPGQPGTARRTSLGIQGAQHQVVAVYDNGTQETNHFIASSLVEADTVGRTDIMLYDITVNEDGTVRYSNLGKLGLSKYRILSYRLVSPKNGATGVDGLGLIWNQHEQENTDDETLDAVAFNRTYVARINRRGDYIYLSHAAQALDLPDEENVADMTAYMDYDASRDCPVVTAAFCIGETQVEGASTAASIIEKKVSLNNEIRWIEAESGLSNIIDKKNGTEIRLAVRNIGLHTIRKFTVTMAGQTFEQEANVKPSAFTTITLKLSPKTDFSDDIPFTITADFYDVDVNNPDDQGNYTGQAETAGQFKVNVVDMCTGLTINRFDSNTKKNVVVISVSNLSPMALKAGNTVKVSLFTDALGDTQYPGVATYSIPVNQLYDATTKSALVKTVRFFVNAPETRTTVYAICHTVDSDGNVVFDQNSSDNTVILSLAPRNTDDGSVAEDSGYNIVTLVRLIQSLKNDAPQPDQDYNGDGTVNMDDVDALKQLILKSTPDHLTVDDLENPQLKVRNAGENIEVEGLNPEKDLKVFDATGQLINWTEPNAENASVKLNRKGTIIVVNDSKAGVIRH